jgi:hypothetical protein
MTRGDCSRNCDREVGVEVISEDDWFKLVGAG